MSGRGSGGNVIAALCSLFIPGLGQLIQGRLFAALGTLALIGVLVLFSMSGMIWLLFFGWVINVFSALDAALYKPEPSLYAKLNKKECPFCGEKILKKAVKCKHCGSDLYSSYSSGDNVSVETAIPGQAGSIRETQNNNQPINSINPLTGYTRPSQIGIFFGWFVFVFLLLIVLMASDCIPASILLILASLLACPPMVDVLRTEIGDWATIEWRVIAICVFITLAIVIGGFYPDYCASWLMSVEK